MNRVSNFNSGGLSGAFGQQPPYQQPYQQPLPQQEQRQVSGGPNPGQPYQIPDQYANEAVGTVITWGQYRYQLGDDGTRTLYTGPSSSSPARTPAISQAEASPRGPTPGQRYRIPAEHAGTAPGTEIRYGGHGYIANNDGTMTAFSESSSGADDAAIERTSTGPVPGKRYQIPAEHASAAPGTEVNYGGHSYITNNDGTMTAFRSPSTDDPAGDAKPAAPVLGKRYQIPADHATTAPGSLITYGGNSYVANDDGTMTAFKSPQ
jgi:hypothetical protein